MMLGKIEVQGEASKKRRFHIVTTDDLMGWTRVVECELISSPRGGRN